MKKQILILIFTLLTLFSFSQNILTIVDATNTVAITWSDGKIEYVSKEGSKIVNPISGNIIYLMDLNRATYPLDYTLITNPASGTGIMVTLSAFNGTSFRVDRAYQGATLSILFTDNSSSFFVCQTGTVVQSLTTYNGFDSVSPESRRKVLLGMY